MQRLGLSVLTHGRQKKDIYHLLASNDPSLTTLKLNRNTINCEALVNALYTNFSLTSLDISDCRINNEKLKLILSAILKNNTVIELKLSNNVIDDEGAKVLAKALQINNTLLELDISSNFINNEGANFIFNALKKNNSLTTLIFSAQYYNGVFDLNRYQFDDESAKNLANVLELNQTLKILNIADQKLSDESLRYIAEAFQKNKTLKKLDISCHEEWRTRKGKIGDAGAMYLAKALKDNQSLEVLSLSNNIISNVGAKLIFEALKFNNTLTTLNLSKNLLKLDESSIEDVSSLIKTNKTLESLFLGYSFRDTQDRKLYLRLLSSLKANTTIKKFDFCITNDWNTYYSQLDRNDSDEYETLISEKNVILENNKITSSQLNNEMKDETNTKLNLIDNALECIQYLLFSDIYNLHLRNQIRFILQDIKMDKTSYDNKLKELNEKIAFIFYSQKQFFFRGRDNLINDEMISFLNALKNKKINRLNDILHSKSHNINKDAELSVLLVSEIERNHFPETCENLPGSNKKVTRTAYNVYMKAIEVYNNNNKNLRFEMLQSIRNLLTEDTQDSSKIYNDQTTQFHQKLFKLVDSHIKQTKLLDNKSNKRIHESDMDAELVTSKKLRL